MSRLGKVVPRDQDALEPSGVNVQRAAGVTSMTAFDDLASDLDGMLRRSSHAVRFHRYLSLYRWNDRATGGSCGS
ncbi:MAG: hypothetical protein DLM70_16215 [Chloroflexi bacterium]|nr:MAG: hypothetical protein DLM70_16215 [Chloroflexota bacterium]